VATRPYVAFFEQVALLVLEITTINQHPEPYVKLSRIY